MQNLQKPGRAAFTQQITRIHLKEDELTDDEIQIYSVFACDVFISTNGHMPIDIAEKFARNGISKPQLIDLCLSSVWDFLNLRTH